MRMRTRGGVLMLAAVAMVTSAVAARAADSVTGEVIDLACYLAHPATSTGPSHKKCAQTCAKKGIPMGILTDDKTVYLLLEDHDNPKPYALAKDHAAEKITVEGNKVTQGGLNGIVVEDVK
jgi:hypothetical protein